MSGSSSYLTSLFSSSTGSDISLLDAVYGIGTSSTQDPVQALRMAEQTETQQLKVTAAQPQVQNTIAAFTKAVKSAKNVAQLLANPTVMNVLLTANGMSDQIGYTALVTKALTSNLKDPSSLANTLTDTRWLAMAKTYNFAANGLSSIQSSTAIAAAASAYVKATWETNEDTVTPGLAKALAFKTLASTVTSVDQILGDATLRSVVTTALGIPEEIAFQDLNAQENAISTQLNVKNFQDPKYVESFAQRYLIANSANSTSSSSSGLTSLAVQGQGLIV